MESNNHIKNIRQGFDTVAVGYEHSSLASFFETEKRLVIEEQFNAVRRNLLNQLSEHEQKLFKQGHQKEIAEMIEDEGVRINTKVLIAVGEK